MNKGLLVAFLLLSSFLIAQGTGTSTQTQSVPGSGGSGSGTVNTGTTGTVAIYPSNGTTVGPAGAGTVPSGASITPVTGSQIVGSGEWVPTAQGTLVPAVPTMSDSNTGGTLTQAGTMLAVITYVGLATAVPSGEVSWVTGSAGNPSSVCASSACSITYTMPTSCTAGNLPAGVTGCTVWTVFNGSRGTEKQQTASAACVNITTATCIVGTAGTGATVTFPLSGIVPANAVQTCPDNIQPTAYIYKGDQIPYSLWGVDTSALNFKTPIGLFTICQPVMINDTTGAPIIANTGGLDIHHMQGTNTTATGTDDRAFTIEMVDGTTPTFSAAAQSLSQYNERIISNNNFNCGGIGGGGNAVGESCAAALRAVTSDTRTAPVNTALGFTAIAGVTSSAGSQTAGSTGQSNNWVGIQGGAFQAVTNQNGNAGTWIGGFFGAQGASGNTNGNGYAILAQMTPANRFATVNAGLAIQSAGTNTSDWDIMALGSTTGLAGRNYFQGQTWLPSIAAQNSTIGVSGSVNITGGIQTTQLATPPFTFGLSTFGTAGAQTVHYVMTGVDVNGNETAATATGSIAANANLTGTNGVTVSLGNNPSAQGYTSFNIYRTLDAGNCNGVACTNGKIGNVAAGSLSQVGNFSPAISFNDTGQVGDGNTAVAQPNSTGGIKSVGLITGKRLSTDSSTTLVSGDFVLSAGWGTTASLAITVTTSKDSAAVVTVTSSGTGQAANPTVAFTFHDGTWTNVPACTMIQTGGTGIFGDTTVNARSATAYTWQWNATPSAAATYEFTILCQGT